MRNLQEKLHDQHNITKAEVGINVLGEALANLRRDPMLTTEDRARLEALRVEIYSFRDTVLADLSRSLLGET